MKRQSTSYRIKRFSKIIDLLLDSSPGLFVKDPKKWYLKRDLCVLWINDEIKRIQIKKENLNNLLKKKGISSEPKKKEQKQNLYENLY